MAELDYAFLADHAQVENGRLFVTGASFTHVQTGGFPSGLRMSVAGRIRAEESSDSTDVVIDITSPGDDGYKLEMAATISDSDGVRPYDGKVGRLFAFGTDLPIPVEGLYEVNISVDGVHARRLAFSVELA